jgi:hypothetical protein
VAVQCFRKSLNSAKKQQRREIRRAVKRNGCRG